MPVDGSSGSEFEESHEFCSRLSTSAHLSNVLGKQRNAAEDQSGRREENVYASQREHGAQTAQDLCGFPAERRGESLVDHQIRFQVGFYRLTRREKLVSFTLFECSETVSMNLCEPFSNDVVRQVQRNLGIFVVSEYQNNSYL